MTVEIREVGADAAQVDEASDGPQQVILRDVIFQRKIVEQRRLRFLLRSHHHRSSPQLQELNQQFRSRSRKSFSTKYALCVGPAGFGGVIMADSPLASSGECEFFLAEKVRIPPTATALRRR
ncbi:hypothetical protein [Roseovarius sp. C03]|uniref:hypothetical protein n=1 Tax=Roseovarius sp. C03 TaxID=3449222 RepID=UPI003EDC73FD